jgi:TonB family protein
MRRRTQRLLLVAFALSLLLHAIIALILHPAKADFTNQAEVVSVVRRSTIAVASQPPPPPRPTKTPSPHVVAAPKPRSRTGNTSVASAGGSGRATPAPPPVPTALPSSTAGNGCTNPNAAAAMVASPAPPEIPAAIRADHISAVALVVVALDAQGQVTGASVAQSTGNSSLDIVAVSMARDARYSATLHDCKPIAGSATFSVKFVAW